MTLTHSDLCRSAADVLRSKRFRCLIVYREFQSVKLTETPDVFGWTASGVSHLCEAKVTRNDFLRDKKKHFRLYPEMGMGQMRYYVTPAGLIAPDELPAQWGLIEISEDRYANDGRRKSKVVRTARTQPAFNVLAERALLLTVQQRITALNAAIYITPKE